MKPYEMSATALKTLLDKQELSTKEIASSCLERIQEVDAKVHAWEYVDEAVIEQQLRKINHYSPQNMPLFGIPIGVKDIYNTFDMPTQMGSPIWKDFTPGNDARMVHYLRRNGALMLGKTVTAEFAVHYQDKTKNPLDLTRSPGTSSSGSAVAVATGTVPIALGSQTAGSIGRPASYCGIYGFKPTFGVLPRIGVLKTTDSLDTLGFLTRSVQDLSLAFEASRVHGRNYEFVHTYIDQYRSDPNKVYRVGIVQHPKWNEASKHAKEAFHAWVQTLNDNRISIEEVTLPAFCEGIHATHQTIYDCSLAYYFKEEYARHELMSPIFDRIMLEGSQITKESYVQALNKQALEVRLFDEWIASYDILITLSTANVAPIGLTTPDTPDGNLIWTYLGLPVVTAPVLKGEENLPIGVNIMTRKYYDKLLLEFLEYLRQKAVLNDVNVVTP